MSPDDWRALLLEYSQALVQWGRASPPEGQELDPLSPWFGRPPATPEELATAEARLGVVLPPAVRSFYEVSNGWGSLGPFVWSLRSLSQLVRADPEVPLLLEVGVLYEGFAEGKEHDPWYQDSVRVKRCICLSLEADAGFWILDPVAGPSGEWPAGAWHSWTGEGFDWHEDLGTLVRHELERLRALPGMG